LWDGKWPPRRHKILRHLALKEERHFHRAPPGQRSDYADDYARALTGSSIGLGSCAKGIPVFETNFTNSNQTIRSFKDACGDLGLSLGNGYISLRVYGTTTGLTIQRINRSIDNWGNCVSPRISNRVLRETIRNCNKDCRSHSAANSSRDPVRLRQV
jgi:hypothetical protein